MLLVEDCALSLLSEPDGRPLGATGDFSVFCLYKTLPVPNGSVLVQNKMPLGALDRLRLRRAGAASVLGRVAELVVQRTRAQANGVGTILQSAKRALGKAAGALEVNRSNGRRHRLQPRRRRSADVAGLRAAAAPLRLRTRSDASASSNFHTLAQALDGKVTPAQAHLPEGVCPLFFPIVVRDKAAAARALRAHGVQALEFWNHGADGADDVTLPTPSSCARTCSRCRCTRTSRRGRLAHMVDRVADLNLQFQS